MGTSESKIAVNAPVKPELPIKKSHLSQLIDPRSPSVGINRTPIQVAVIEPKAIAEVKSEFSLGFSDPRSPTIGIIRTPVREVMRATIGSFAHRLGMLFHSEAEGKVPETSQKRFMEVLEENLDDEELASTEPLLSAQMTQNFSSLAEHADLLATPVRSQTEKISNSSPFVLLEEVEIETEADISLEEAQEARESPLHKRLSMSLITCHEGATSSQIFAEVHNENASSPKPSVETYVHGSDHSYAIPSLKLDPGSPESCLTKVTDTSPVEQLPVRSEEEEKVLTSEENVLNEKSSVPLESSPSKSPGPTMLEQPQVCTGIRCPTFDTKSPSQVEFKPQWLGKGFGASGLRARKGKGNSSPLAVSVAVKNATNENKGHSGKLKQRGSGVRSPLQILKGTNSPRDQHSQMKLKMSTPGKQRLGQMDHRVQAYSLDKENRALD